MSKTLTNLGTEHVRWDLSVLYTGVDDPEIDRDVQVVITKASAYKAAHKGHLRTALSAALSDMAEIEMISHRLFVFLHLKKSLDVSDESVSAKIAEIEMKLQPILADSFAFFDIELSALSDADITTQAEAEPYVQQHLPFIHQKRVFTPHHLSEEVEAALGKRSLFGSGAWSTFFNEIEARLQFNFEGRQLGLEEMTHLMSESKSATQRAAALKVFNHELGQNLAPLASFSLYQVTGEKALEDKERSFPHAMSYRNLDNMVPDATVDALHQATTLHGAPLAQRYYRLKANILKLPVLEWSDRNAPLPFADETQIPFDQAMHIVVTAYRRFSPTLASLVEAFVDDQRIDAHVTPNRGTGAYNYSGVFPGNMPMSFTFLNYLGSRRDVMTVAHELGHGVHGILAGQAQGVLQSHPPTAYCETASIFGEMMTFHYVLEGTTEVEEKMSLLCGKIEDMLNSVVRQISFSNFERRIHGDGRRRSVADLDTVWMEETQRMYGPDGDVFRYKNANHLWSYVSHFHRPFYVYGYAFGELLTQSLFAKKDAYGARFEPLYLDLLKAGSTKDAVALLQPLGLDPTQPDFWSAGIEVSLGRLISQAEELWHQYQKR